MKDFKQVDCFKTNFKLWKFLGVYPLDISQPYFYAFYAKMFIFFFIVMYSILLTFNIYFIPKNLDIYIDEMIFYFTVLSIMCKVLTFFFKRDDIRNLISIVESDIFQPEIKEGIEITNKAKSTIRRYFKIYTAVCITSNFVHIFAPLINHFVFGAELFLPVCSYFFLSDNIIQYYIYPLYFYQIIGMHFHVLFVVSIDNFVLGLTFFLIAQLEIIKGKLIKVTDSFESETKTHQNEAHLISKLNKVFLHYGKVAKFCSSIEEVFSITVFVHFSMGSYIICMCLIRFTMPATWQFFIFLSTYSFAMLVQFFFPCWVGTRIMDKSCQLGHAIYECDWTPRSKYFKSSMRLFVERTKRPLSIIGGKMFLLSLITFTSIMNTAYSFFTVLRQMQSR